VISGFEGWEDIEEFSRSRLTWLRKYLPYAKGIPSHDTIARVICKLNPKKLQTCFVDWVSSISEVTEGEIISIDGKTVRRSFKKGNRKSAIHMVSAWASQNQLVLGQTKVSDKSNEITAIPALLSMLEIKGCLITIDAMGCQSDIAEKIIDSGGDYLLSVKDNQKHLHEDIKAFFDTATEHNFNRVKYDFDEQIDFGHGRIETRRCWVSSNLMTLRKSNKWKGLKQIVKVQRKREIKGKKSSEDAYYISSKNQSAKEINHAARQHWGVENSLHWVLDVTFREDESRIRRGNAAENFAVSRHIALNLVKKHPGKDSNKRKRLKAALYDEFRDEILMSNQIYALALFIELYF